MAQTAQAFLEAEVVPRPVADHRLQPLHRPRLRHGHGAEQQKLAVDSGVWPLYRFDPRRLAKGEPPLHLDYGPPKVKVAEYMRNESRFRDGRARRPRALQAVRRGVAEGGRAPLRVYEQLAGITVPAVDTTGDDHDGTPTRWRA